MEVEKEAEKEQPKELEKDENGKTRLTLENNVREVMDPFTMQDLDHLICFSIDQIGDLELKKKMANFVLIVGGGCHVLGTVEEFEDRLINTFSLYDMSIERVEVINPLGREVPPDSVSWVGGTVIQRLDSMKELWVSRAKWLGEVEKDEEEDGEKKIKRDKGSDSFGVKLLREKLPFLW